MYGYIYKIENKVNNKVYIGLTTQHPKKRYSNHLNELINNRYNNKYLQNTFNKYEKKSFKFQVLNYANSREAAKLELDYTKKYNSLDKDFGYNLIEGGYERSKTGKR